MTRHLALLSAWVLLAGASAVPLKSELKDDYSSYRSDNAKIEPLENQLLKMRFFPADGRSQGLTTPSAFHVKRAGQPEYVGGDPQPEVRLPDGSTREAVRLRDATTMPMPAAAGSDEDDDEDESPEDDKNHEESAGDQDDGEEDEEEEEEDGEEKRSRGGATTTPALETVVTGDGLALASTTPQVPATTVSPGLAGDGAPSLLAQNNTSRQKLVDSVDPGADEDLLELMVRIAESPEEWQRIHNTLQALDQDLAASRSAVVELEGLKGAVNKRSNVYSTLRGENSWNKMWAQQGVGGESDSDRRRAELERAGLLPESKPRQKVHTKPGEKSSTGHEQRDVLAGNRWPPSVARQKGELGNTWSGGRADKTRQGNIYLSTKIKGKHKIPDSSPTQAKQSKQYGNNRMSSSKPYSYPKSAVDYEDARRHGKVVLMKQDSRPREPPRRYFDDEGGHHGRVVYREGENGADNWSEMVNNRNMDMGRTADRWQQNLKMLRQHEWLHPSEHPVKVKHMDVGHRAMAKMPLIAKNTYAWPRQQAGAYASYGHWPDLSMGSLVDTWPDRDRDMGATKQWPTFPDEDEDDIAGANWPKHPGVDSITSRPQLSTNSWPGQKPARQWPQFAYHRVTSSPRELAAQAQAKQRARQRSAFIAVSVVSPAATRNRSGEGGTRGSVVSPGRSKVGGMLDPLEQQLLQLTAKLATPWSHVRHLNNIKAQMKTMSKMKEKLLRHWLERQNILRENDPGFQRSARNIAPTTSRPSSQK